MTAGGGRGCEGRVLLTIRNRKGGLEEKITEQEGALGHPTLTTHIVDEKGLTRGRNHTEEGIGGMCVYEKGDVGTRAAMSRIREYRSEKVNCKSWRVGHWRIRERVSKQITALLALRNHVGGAKRAPIAVETQRRSKVQDGEGRLTLVWTFSAGGKG